MPGIDKPANADDSWRPSILEHLRFAQIAISFAERNNRPADPAPEPQMMETYWKSYEDKRGYTPAQRMQAKGLRDLMKKFR